MTAVLLTVIGGPDVLHRRHNVLVPFPKKGQVLIYVRAAGVINTHISTRIGWYSKSVKGSTADQQQPPSEGEGQGEEHKQTNKWRLVGMKLPRIQGADVAGRIVAVGEGIDVSQIGSRVIVGTFPSTHCQ